jgi:hypothetical protein
LGFFWGVGVEFPRSVDEVVEKLKERRKRWMGWRR